MLMLQVAPNGARRVNRGSLAVSAAAAPRPGSGNSQPAQRVATDAAAVLEAETSSPIMSKIEMWQGKKLQTQVFPLAKDTVAIRSLDWDRDRFDIEFG
jgi:hypothetical protein